MEVLPPLFEIGSTFSWLFVISTNAWPVQAFVSGYLTQ